MKTLTTEAARKANRHRKRRGGGRPPGATMTCGWGCGAELTSMQMRQHFIRCPNRPRKTKHA